MSTNIQIEELIKDIINRRVASILHDIMIIETNYFDGYIPFEDSQYKNKRIHTLVETGIAESTLSVLRTINIEMELYKTFLSDNEFIDEFAYVVSIDDLNSNESKIIRLVLNAKYELALLSMSGIGKDYERDTEVIQREADRVAKHSEVTGSLSIPKKKKDIVNLLCIKLDQLFLHISKNKARKIIKSILTNFFDYDRMPSFKMISRIGTPKRNDRQSIPIIIETIPAPKLKITPLKRS